MIKPHTEAWNHKWDGIHLTDEDAEVQTDLPRVPPLVYFANKGDYH